MGLAVSDIVVFQTLSNEVTDVVQKLIAKGYKESDIVVALLGRSKSLMSEINDRASWDQAKRDAADYILA